MFILWLGMYGVNTVVMNVRVNSVVMNVRCSYCAYECAVSTLWL